MVIETLDNIACDVSPVADSHLANKGYVDSAIATVKSGGSLPASNNGGNVVAIPAMSLIDCDSTPTENAHLANKGYVDGAIAEALAAPAEEIAGLGIDVVYVTTLSDAVSHEGVSLRDAITAVTNKGSVVIKFSVSGTITLEQGEIIIPVGGFTIDGEDKITISGGGVSRVFSMTNAYAVLKLCRLTITGGNGVGASYSQQYGGAIYLNQACVLAAYGVTFSGNSISGSAATVGGGAIAAASGHSILVDCVFRNNSAVTSATGTSSFAYGGAIYMSAYSSMMEITNCTFEANTVEGAYVSGGGAVTANCGVFRGCTFKNHTVTAGTYPRGGAALITGSSFVDCVFQNNTVGTGASANEQGGAVFANGIFARIENCVFQGNCARGGSAIIISGNTNRQYYNVVKHCVFDNNISGASFRGVAIYVTGCIANIEDCEFKNHDVGTASGLIYTYGNSNLFYVTINRCKFLDNTGSFTTGGILYICNSMKAVVANSLFKNNTFTGTSGYHRCIYVTNSGSNAVIQNCTFVSNTGGGAFYATANTTISVYNTVEYGNTYTSSAASSVTFTASKFLSDKASEGRDITYNSGLPLFKADGYTPGVASQVINAGLSANCDTTIDLLGNPRVVGTSVDLGAVEYQG